jgi:hypothetical protein
MHFLEIVQFRAIFSYIYLVNISNYMAPAMRIRVNSWIHNYCSGLLFAIAVEGGPRK